MKCLVKNESAVGLTLKEKEKPSPKDNEILIKVKKAAICGTDLHTVSYTHLTLPTKA